MEPRKASEVLLELESKFEVMLSIIKSQDLNIKVLSNKLNMALELLEKQSATPPKITVEAVNTMAVPPQYQKPLNMTSQEKQILISSEDKLPLDESPSGFRRTSRPETYSGDDMYLNQGFRDIPSKFPAQPSKEATQAEVIVPAKATANKIAMQPPQLPITPVKAPTGNSIPVVQRIVDRNGKSVFLADVEILNSATSEQVFKTRTNGTGKWMASLNTGEYRVIIRKRESVSKEKVEVIQNIQVTGTTSPLELQTMIIK